MSIREFSERLGVSDRLVSKWEAAREAIFPRPVNQAALDTCLSRAGPDVEARFALLVADASLREPKRPPGAAIARRLDPVGDEQIALPHSRDDLGLDQAAGDDRPRRRSRQGIASAVPHNLFQLPPGVTDFTGRSEDIAELTELLTWEPIGNAVEVAAFSGKAGIGKTTLAVHVAHRVRDFFPDGQLYVDLRGVQAPSADPSEVLGRFLNELGLDAGSIPDQMEHRARLYRAQLAERSVLVVLDNAANEAQVRPLLPGNPDCAALVTSRKRLIGLAGAHHVPLDVMTARQGLDLLGAIAGNIRATSESGPAKDIVQLCGRLPLALRIAGARLASRPNESLVAFATHLRDERSRLDLLKAGDLEVRASFALSLDSCDDTLRRAFGLLGVLKATDFAAWALALLADCPVRQAEGIMERLVDAELLEISAEDVAGGRRYRFHDLLRVFAGECLIEAESGEARTEAVERLLTECVWLGTNAAALLEPGGLAHPVAALPEALTALERDPRGWFQAERSAFVAGVRLAFEYELWELAWRLAELLPVLFRWQSDWTDWAETHAIALDATQRCASREGEARVRCSLGLVYRAQGRYRDAIAELSRSAQIFADVGDELRAAVARRQLGDTYRYTGRLHEGVEAFTASLDVFQRNASMRMTAGALNGLGDIYRGMSRWQDSIDCFTRCTELYELLGDKLEVARAKVRFGIVYRDQCRYDQAEELYSAGLAELRATNDRRWEARTLRHLGIVYRNTGQISLAFDHFELCLDQFEQLADHRGVAVTLRNMGDAHRYAGDVDKAGECLSDALCRFRDLGDVRWEARTLISQADTIRRGGKGSQAGEQLESALAICRTVDDKPGEARVFRSLGLLRRDQRKWQDALGALEKSRGLFESLGDQVWAARAMAGQAATLKARGNNSWRELRDRAERLCLNAGAANPDQVRNWLHEW